MGAYRKGIILQFGMVNCIVNVETAITRAESLTTVCTGVTGHPDHAPTKISQVRRCATCNDEVPYGEQKKAREVGEGAYVVIEQDEVASVKAETVGATKKLLTLTPHDANEVLNQTLQGESFYYLVPSDVSQAPAYAMLMDAVNRHPEYAMVGLWTPSSRTNIYRLTTFNGEVLALESRQRPENIAAIPTGVANLPPVSEPLQKQFDLILPTMAQPFDPSTYADTYESRMAELIASREAVEGIVLEKAKSSPRTAPAVGGVDLMATLQAMAEAANA